MSGGSMDYLCFRVADAADGMLDPVMNEITADFAKVLRELEWFTSGDTSAEDYYKTVNEFKQKWLKPEWVSYEVRNENNA